MDDSNGIYHQQHQGAVGIPYPFTLHCSTNPSGGSRQTGRESIRYRKG
jgi:hypothetical protein